MRSFLSLFYSKDFTKIITCLGKYNKRLSGYSDVFTFPKGAASIKIQQKSFRNQVHDGNYLALVQANGNYILNGGLTLTTIKKDIKVNGKKQRFLHKAKI